jgi:hypothetical protein
MKSGKGRPLKMITIRYYNVPLYPFLELLSEFCKRATNQIDRGISSHLDHESDSDAKH